MKNTLVTVVIPVYNDVNALRESVPRVIKVLESLTSSYELIIAEDASNDGSAEVAADFAKNNSFIIHLHRNERLGRGSALSKAAFHAKGEIFCYFDVDMATDLSHLGELLGAIKEGFDISTGSRLLPDSKIIRSYGREIKSRGYNLLVRLILHSRISDHQCGFKAFKTSSVRMLLPEIMDKHWFWDTEILVRAQRKGLLIKEIPVIWTEGKGTTVRSGDIWKMGRQILRLWWQLHVS
ncbi:MAG: glycosyltransferase family 2 protein [Methanomicrobiales archaeon]|nr:glycosyltransferase family 2 protein [Methanomicrobiales archaeon]